MNYVVGKLFGKAVLFENVRYNLSGNIWFSSKFTSGIKGNFKNLIHRDSKNRMNAR